MIICENIIAHESKQAKTRARASVSNIQIMTKSELRKIYLARQKNLSATERTEKSRAISAQFFQKFGLANINFLHCFLPIEKFNEIDTSFIFEKIRRDFPNVKTVVPRVEFETLEMKSLIYKSETELSENVWNIREPLHDEVVETEKIDVVLVPLLCFDGEGFRVGYGKGFYDRFLKNCRTDCLKIGLSYFAPVVKIADTNKFDVTPDYCVTPKKIYDFISV
jgi:5-formyltetrahydrofolate cyclo-ligase